MRTMDARPDAVPPGAGTFRTSRGVGSSKALVSALALAATLMPAARSRADLEIVAPSFTAAPGSSGSFDVLIENTSNPVGGATYDVSTDTLELTLSGPPGVTFQDVSIASATSYLYVASGTTSPGGLPLDYGITFPTTDLTVSDSEFNPPDFYRAIAPGAAYGLARVSYAVAPSAAGGVVTVGIGSGTLLYEADGITSIAFTPMDGSITIATAVPELPTSVMWLFALAMGPLVFRAWRRPDATIEPVRIP